MLLDKLRGMIRSGLDWKKILMYGLPVVTFIIGLMVPSPLYDRLRKDPVADEKQQLVEVTGLIMADGSRYDGSIIKGTKTRHGFGRLTTADSTVYEGNWRNDELPYGQRTSLSSIYRGKFDKSLNNEGFGIIEYSDAFVNGKRKQGKADCDIVRKYIGNWHKNAKEGLGRSVKMDGSMDFVDIRMVYFKPCQMLTIVLVEAFMALIFLIISRMLIGITLLFIVIKTAMYIMGNPRKRSICSQCSSFT